MELRERVAEAIESRCSAPKCSECVDLTETVMEVLSEHVTEGLAKASEIHLGAFGTMPEEDALAEALRSLGLEGERE